MKIYDMASTTYDSMDDAVVDLADAIKEVQELEESRNSYRDEVARLEDENTRLKEKNLELLSRIPIEISNKVTEPEVVEEELTLDDIFDD